MRFLDYSIWSGSIVLEAVVLLRGYFTRLYVTYPVFYSYIAFVLLQSFLRLGVYQISSHLYAYVYWVTEFIGVGLGCAVVFEIYRVGLATYPGTARMARQALAFIFVLAATKVLVEAATNSGWWAATTAIAMERSLRVVQALGIAALVGVFLVYAIPFGRNLRGLLLGYGLFISASVLWFTFAESGGDRFRYFWSYLNPGSYDLALGLWTVCLWSREPVPQSGARMEERYLATADRTRQRLREARGRLGKVVEP